MTLIYTFSNNEDPAILSKQLWQHKIAHRVRYENGQNELWLLDLAHLNTAQSIIHSYQNDTPLNDSLVVSENTPSFWLKMYHFAIQFPVTCLLFLASILLTVLTSFGDDISLSAWFMFLPIFVQNGALYAASFDFVLEQHQYWRLVTPIFLHFSIMHLCFNLLWMWDVGRKVERTIGGLVYLLGVVLIGIASNCLQYFIGETPLFGGMSGVVYGVIGFAWLLPKFYPALPTLVSQPVMIFMLICLALGYTQIFSFFGVGNIANTAHLAGLISGLVLAVLYKIYRDTMNKAD